MRAVIFTMHYPYGVGEVFLVDEMQVATNLFDNITIVSLEKPPLKVTYDVSANTEVIAVRKDLTFSKHIISIARQFLKVNVYKEIVNAVKERGAKEVINIAKSVVLAESAIECLLKNESKWKYADPDVVYYSYWLDVPATYLARRKNELGGICISRAHGGDCFYDRGYHPFRKTQITGLDYIFPISAAGLQDMLFHDIKYEKRLKEKISVDRLGIIKDSSKLNPWVESNSKRIVTCSNIIPLKRLDLLIKALAEINEADIEWIHFGDGYLRGEIEKLSEEYLKEKTNITYEFKGHCSKKDIFAYYENKSIDLFINCSDAEGIPVSMMEAMAYGIPAMGRDVGGINELIDNENGFLLDNEITVSELARNIVRGLQDSAGLAAKRVLATKTIDEKYDAIINYESFYRKIRGYKINERFEIKQ